MARILGQIRCGRCQRRFWPEHGASAVLVIVCPSCAAPHANPEALPVEPHRSSLPELQAWLRRYWIDGPPGKSGMVGCQMTRLEAFDCCVVYGAIHYKNHTEHWTLVLVSAHITDPSVLAGLPVTPARGGFYRMEDVHPGESPLAYAATMLGRILPHLRGRRVEPLLGIDEVDDPEPLDAHQEERELGIAPDADADARVESQSVRCHRCGAPTALAALVGANCPFCAAPQSLSPDVARELALYQKRVHAAQLRLAPRAVTGLISLPAMKATMPGFVMLACASCGAPNMHRNGVLDEACTSCRAPLVPSKSAMARAIAGEAAKAARSHGRQGIAIAVRARDTARRNALCGAIGMGIMLVYGGGSYVLSFAPMIADGYHGWQRIAVLVLVFGLAFAILTGIIIAAWRWYVRYTRQQRALWDERITPLAEQLGAPLGTSDALIAWAGHWWSDRIAPSWLVDTTSQSTLAFHRGGLPCAITMHLPDSSWLTRILPQHVPHLVVLLAAQLPRDVAYWARTPQARQIIEDLTNVGFGVELRTGGLALIAGSILGRFQAEPDRMTLLAPVTTALVRLAHVLRAEPPEPASST